MKILGLGTDIVNVDRIKKMLIKHDILFKNKIFDNSEIKLCDKRKNNFSSYAKRFAAKEAFAKALGTGIKKGVSLKDIIVKNDKSGMPFIELSNKIKKVLKKKSKNKKYQIYLSLSDDIPWAQATVIITCNS